MNILYLCDEYPPGRHGGIGTAVQLLAREVVKQGHNVVVAGFYDWSYQGEDYFVDNGVKVYRFRRDLIKPDFKKGNSLYKRIAFKYLNVTGVLHRDIKKSLVKYGAFLETLIKKYNIDIIEMPDYNDYMKYCKAYVGFPVLSKPVIVKLHGSIVYFANEAHQKVPRHLWQMEHDMLQQAFSVVSVSRYTAEQTARYLEYSKQILVLYNGIEIAVQPKTNKVVGSVVFTGTLIEKKGIQQLMKAWNIVCEQKSGVELIILGKGNIKKIKKILNTDAVKSVRFLGHVKRSTLFDFLCTSEVAIFPSFAESFGLAPLESMMCGTATIFTKTTSGPEIINDGKDGLLVNPENVKEIADKILLLLNDHQYNTKLALNGQRSVKEKFDIRRIAADNILHYSSVIK